ncbi:MAG: DNA polymerase III subunit gamma/tau, partial [Agathobacter sp.]|nr:DNA polymerase III subunit gamma/tau [Agathobacter sp.]
YEYLYEDRAGCVTNLKAAISERVGKEIEITIQRTEDGQTAKDSVVDLRDLINFDIEIEDF